MRAHLAAEAALLVAAERRGRVVDVVGVDPDGAGLEPRRDVVRLLDVARPDAGGEAVDRVVRARDRLVHVDELDRREHRSEDLLARDRHLGRDVREHRRLHEVALAGADVGAAAAGDERRAFALRDLDVAQHALELALRRDRAEPRLRIERIAGDHLLRRARRPCSMNCILDRPCRRAAASRRRRPRPCRRRCRSSRRARPRRDRRRRRRCSATCRRARA